MMRHILGAALGLMLLAAPAGAGDSRQAAGLPAPSADDMPWLPDWLGAVRSANSAILYFAADPQQFAAIPPEQVARSLAPYEDQLAAASRFLHQMFPRTIATALDFIKVLAENPRRAPARQDGIAAGRPTPQTIGAIADALRENAGTWSKQAPPAKHGRLAKAIAAAHEKAGELPSAQNLSAVLNTPGK